MKCLLDTHTFIWLITEDTKLSSTARNCILDGHTTLYLSSASIWEIVIKSGIGKLRLPDHPQTFITKQLTANFIEELPISFKHAFYLQQLPDHHKDPFDRILVAQAICEKLSIVTIDPIIAQYPVKTVW
jgi:PIN domain nuclease of toxin-antitoxin system